MAAVEFALILVPFLILLFGMIQYSMYFWSAQTGSASAREVLRRASVGACTDAQLKTFVDTRLGGARDASDPSNFTVTRTFYKADGVTTAPAPGVVGGVVRIDVTFPSHNMHFPFVPFLSDATITRDIDARLENTASTGACT